jgi:hypothetical protein
MFHVPPVTVNVGLVQFPCSCVRGTSTTAVPVPVGAAVVEVVGPAMVVEGDGPVGTVVGVVDCEEGTVVVLVDPAGGGIV